MAPGKRVTDPLQWGYSLSNVFELLSAGCWAIETKTVLSKSAPTGAVDGRAARMGADTRGQVAVDPCRRTSSKPASARSLNSCARPAEVLHEREFDDAIIIDGDHKRTLMIIGERAPGCRC